MEEIRDAILAIVLDLAGDTARYVQDPAERESGVIRLIVFWFNAFIEFIYWHVLAGMRV